MFSYIKIDDLITFLLMFNMFIKYDALFHSIIATQETRGNISESKLIEITYLLHVNWHVIYVLILCFLLFDHMEIVLFLSYLLFVCLSVVCL